MLGYVINPVGVRWRTWRGREQHHTIGSVEIVLPPEHDLPFYQRRDPTYDAYAIGHLARLAAGDRVVVDWISPESLLAIPAPYGERLIQALAESGRTLLVHDNLGRRMVELPPGDTAGLRTPSRWLHEQVDGHVVVPYLDVRALTDRAAQLLQTPVRR
ncbi:hypothetical protein C1C97_004315 [Kocuria tytonis]|uniref:Uncharacterized protein n=2 Tax=Kocuria tytonis TaxID=2054280 RepID=A0A495AA05_9MICC|nr:hypothetical protein C1C97_004315 [Kocuria tytonis]